MGAIVFIIIVIAIVVSTLNKQKKEQARDQQRNQSNVDAYGRPYQQKTSSAKQNNRYAEKKAAAHAKTNMSQEELKSRPSAAAFREMAGVDESDGAILSAAKMHSFATELSNEYDSKEDLMEPVWDLMVKGPDTSVPNERDFVSEGMDLINSYTINS